MTILRGPRPQTDYTTFRNELLNDESLAADSLGVLVYLLSKPDNWRVMPSDLQRRFSCGKDRIYRILGDLQQAGYADIHQEREGGAFVRNGYVIHEKAPLPENPEMALPLPAQPLPENPPLQRTESTKNGLDSPAKPQEHKRKAKGIEYTEQFEAEVWGPYPRKEGTSKKKAFEKFRWLPETDQALVIKTIPIYAKQKSGKDPEFIKHLQFFLSERIFDTISVSRLVAGASGGSEGGSAPQSYQTFNHRQWERALAQWRLDGIWRDYWGPRPGHVASRVPVELLWPHELSVNGGLTGRGAMCDKVGTGESHGGSHS